jgi:hypothetical protein
MRPSCRSCKEKNKINRSSERNNGRCKSEESSFVSPTHYPPATTNPTQSASSLSTHHSCRGNSRLDPAWLCRSDEIPVMTDDKMYTAPELSKDLRDEEEKVDDRVDDDAAESVEERRFQPLQGGTRPNALTRPASGTSLHSRSPSTSASVRRMRSQNGHGCADDSDDAPACTGFEVVWESDQDPMCPRSMSHLHKWVLVVIVSMGGLCV